MGNRWTGGQYSLFRVLLALCFLLRFLDLLLVSSGIRIALLALGLVLATLFGAGFYDRFAAVGLLILGAFSFTPDSLDFACLVWLLLAHLFLPSAPFGSWTARGRVDPAGGWRYPSHLFAATWTVLALVCLVSGFIHLANPFWRGYLWSIVALEFAFAPLALVSALRPWLWLLTFLTQGALFALLSPSELGFGLLMLHLSAFDPGWIPSLSRGTERIFYDGHCGLCQRSVRVILAEDVTENAFRFAPLQGETFQTELTQQQREGLPLSVVVRTESGTLLTRSSGVLHVLRRLGGIWRLLAGFLALIPQVVRDGLYDGVARIRHRLFAQPTETCPLMPPHVRKRFDP